MIPTTINKLKGFIKLKTLKRIQLRDNQPLTDAEFQRVTHICDIFTAIAETAGMEMISPPTGGVFWEKARQGMGPYDLYLRKNRAEINHSLLLYNCFRDFCALAYEFKKYTPKPDYWVRRYLRLTEGLPQHWHVKMPARFAELGWNINGFPVNRWTSVNQERICAIRLAGITHYLENLQAPKILEIGGGSGEMGYVLSKALSPKTTWFNADLLGCLIYSAIHLSVLLPEKRHYIYVGNLELPQTLDPSLLLRSPKEAAACQNAIVYIPHFLLTDFVGHLRLHFAYNTYSFGEMPKQAVAHYAQLLAGFLQEFGMLFEQNGYFPDRGGDNVENILSMHFKPQTWPTEFDGRLFPNGPTRLWHNNDIGAQIQRLIPKDDITKIIKSLNDKNDKVDISYPNSILWPKVYELFEAQQRVKELYVWSANPS